MVIELLLLCMYAKSSEIKISTMKECFYDVLGIDRKADDDAIKKAYRQMALRNHPDKQTEDNREAATARFQLISEAYEVLSNKQERAWYDSHREQILRCGDASLSGNGSHSTKEDIWKYFSTSCFGGKYDDSEGGFYKTYGALFEELTHLERDEYDAESDDEDHVTTFPAFGGSRAEWEDVQAFYTQWSNFQSTRRFGGFDKWNLREGENRQVRRAMEAENKKSRNAARKEYSSAVRSLVSFVKRRDKRVVEFQAKQAAAERLAKELKEKEQREREHQRRAAREQARIEEMQRWQELEKQKLERGEVSSEGSDQNEDEKVELFCVACNKAFKSEKAFANHEGSKKHKAEVTRLREELLLSDIDDDVVEAGEKLVEPVDIISTRSKKNKKKKGRTISDDEDDKASDIRVSPQIVLEPVEAPAGERKPRRRKDKAIKAEENQFACKSCGATFQSKSALFRHLDEAGHHALVSINRSGRK